MHARNTIGAAGLLAAAALAIAPAAPAQGWSIGLGAGESELEDFCDFSGSGVSCDDTDTANKLFAGFDLNENFRLEGFWIDLGEAEIRNNVGDFAETDADGYGFAAMPMLPTTRRVDVFAKIGLFAWDGEITTNVFGPTETFSDDGTDPFFGFGIRGELGSGFGLRGEWEQFDLDGDDVTVISVGGELRF